MNRKLTFIFLSRLIRSKDARIFWVVRHPDDIPLILDTLCEMTSNFKYSRAERMLKLIDIGVTVKFMTNDDRADRLQGAIIDEVFIDEAG